MANGVMPSRLSKFNEILPVIQLLVIILGAIILVINVKATNDNLIGIVQNHEFRLQTIEKLAESQGTDIGWIKSTLNEVKNDIKSWMKK